MSRCASGPTPLARPTSSLRKGSSRDAYRSPTCSMLARLSFRPSIGARGERVGWHPICPDRRSENASVGGSVVAASDRHNGLQMNRPWAAKCSICRRNMTQRDRPQPLQRLSEYGVTSLIEGSNPSLSVLQIAAGSVRDSARCPTTSELTVGRC
jgi:hypothetical protein